MKPSGKINLIAVVAIAALVGGAYWVVIFAPVYLDNVSVKDTVTAAYNRSSRSSDEALRTQIQSDTERFGTHKEDDGYGHIVDKPGLGLTNEQITIERDTVRQRVMVRVEYTREVVMKPFGKVKRIKFAPMKEGPTPP